MLNQAIVDEWLAMYLERLLETFGERLVFAGCQGSWGRGEGRPNSDIDAVAILDRIETEDLTAYRGLIAAMPYADKACGLFWSTAQLRCHEPRCEILHLWYGIKTLYGSMEDIADPPTDADLVAELRLRMSSTLHNARHYLLFPHDIGVKVHRLHPDSRYAPLSLRWWILLTTGVYHAKTADLVSSLTEPLDIEITRIARDWEELAEDRSARPLYYMELLERWARDLMNRTG